MNSKIHGKYTVTRKDGTEIDPNAHYFVMRFDIDLNARKAILAYADLLKASEPVLAAELRGSIEMMELMLEKAEENDDDTN